ncbi:hypothetical protein [Micromonospora aurantiaca]|uniref:hypothetical protein n=1 Tax=Micromonospora aurantiaca (nom. illeg.) TaxID=47850 RepID=UPI0037F58438
MERDWLDYTGYVFNVLATSAGLFGLFLAIKAYRVGVQAYEVSAESYRVAKEQGRKTFELSLLTELNSELSRVTNNKEWQGPGSLPKFNSMIYSVLLTFPRGELPLWDLIARSGQSDKYLNEVRDNPRVKVYLSKAREGKKTFSLTASVVFSLFDEVHEAMRNRIE